MASPKRKRRAGLATPAMLKPHSPGVAEGFVAMAKRKGAESGEAATASFASRRKSRHPKLKVRSEKAEDAPAF